MYIFVHAYKCMNVFNQEILNSNTLELARQLCILYNSLFRKIQVENNEKM